MKTSLAVLFYSYERFYFVSSQKQCTGQNFPNFSRKFFEFFALAEIFSTAQFFFQNLSDIAAIRLVQKSSKSEPSSPFFGRLKFQRNFVLYKLLQNFLCRYKIEMAIWHLVCKKLMKKLHYWMGMDFIYLMAGCECVMSSS